MTQKIQTIMERINEQNDKINQQNSKIDQQNNKIDQLLSMQGSALLFVLLPLHPEISLVALLPPAADLLSPIFCASPARSLWATVLGCRRGHLLSIPITQHAFLTHTRTQMRVHPDPSPLTASRLTDKTAKSPSLETRAQAESRRDKRFVSHSSDKGTLPRFTDHRDQVSVIDSQQADTKSSVGIKSPGRRGLGPELVLVKPLPQGGQEAQRQARDGATDEQRISSKRRLARSASMFQNVVSRTDSRDAAVANLESMRAIAARYSPAQFTAEFTELMRSPEFRNKQLDAARKHGKAQNQGIERSKSTL